MPVTLLAALQVAARVSTLGCAGFAYFTTPSGASYLGAANFWDGVSPDMSASSVLYSVAPAAAGTNGSLALAEVQRFPTQGAHGLDFFTTVDAQHSFLVIPNYYGCGEARGPAQGPCASTAVYRLAPPGSPDVFVPHQRLLTAGPAQTGHLLLSSGAALLLVGENFADQVCTYALQLPGGSFARQSHQPCLPVPGAGALAAAEAHGHAYLVAASYHDPHSGWETRSRVFRAPVPAAPEAPLAWQPHQELPSQGAHGAHLRQLGSQHLLVLAEDRGSAGPAQHSTLYHLSAATGRFELLQRLPTDGAHGARLFEGPGGQPYLAVANFGDRLGGRVAARSSLWRGSNSSSSSSGLVFERVAEVATQGATDVEHWVGADGRHFVAIAEEGDIGKRRHQRSFVRELTSSQMGGKEPPKEEL